MPVTVSASRRVDLDQPRAGLERARPSGPRRRCRRRPGRRRPPPAGRGAGRRRPARRAAGSRPARRRRRRGPRRAPRRSAASTIGQSSRRRAHARLVELGQRRRSTRPGPRGRSASRPRRRRPCSGMPAVVEPRRDTTRRHGRPATATIDARQPEVARRPDRVGGLAARARRPACTGRWIRPGSRRSTHADLVDRGVQRDADDAADRVVGVHRHRLSQRGRRSTSARVGWPSVPPGAPRRQGPAGDARSRERFSRPDGHRATRRGTRHRMSLRRPSCRRRRPARPRPAIELPCVDATSAPSGRA